MIEVKYKKKSARREFIKAHVGRPRTALEIGALNAPVFGSKVKVRYADRFSTAELARKYPHKSGFVNVDYVLTETAFSEHIRERFQCVVANHVIEHIPDLINWLDQLSKLVEGAGWVFLAVPDKRYTFDIARPLTTLADLIDCAHRELTSPSVGQIFAHLYMNRKVTTQDIWDGKDVDISQPRIDVSKAVKSALSMVETYHSVHCHVFTADSFAQLMRELYTANLSDWALHALQDPQPGGDEFLVALKKAR
jgi:Methyltransferase domain